MTLSFARIRQDANNMKDRLRRCAAIASFVFAGWLSACVCSPTQKGATVLIRSPEAASAFVRKVDYREAPELKELAERARRIGNEVYPKILTLLAYNTSKLPQQFDIVFKEHVEFRNFAGYECGAYAMGKKIYLAADLLQRNPNLLDVQLVHEIAHVAQHYDWPKVPPYWTEGIADYLRFKLGYTNGWSCPQCSALYPHYTDGYTCAGALLLYVDMTYGSNVVRQLNKELRSVSYSDAFFVKASGKSLKELWGDFRKTPFFTPAAGDILKLEESLGYVNGQPPVGLDVGSISRINEARAETYIKQQPGGRLWTEAVQFLKSLKDNNRLPGWSRGEHGKILFQTYLSDLQKAIGDFEPYPFSKTLVVNKNSDHSIYHYIVVRESKDASWKLEKAWRTSRNGRIVEEYAVP